MSFIISAPASGAGKTTLTLGLLRALSQDGQRLQGAKSGPDYIDPQFHAAACGRLCLNLDAWAMTPGRIRSLAAGDALIIEGAMGLFDGAPPGGKGATADLARELDLPVIFVVDARRMAQSIAPLVAGFATHDPHVKIAGVILNKVGSDRHAALLTDALAQIAMPVLGAIPRSAAIAQPSRHLGLVQAQERTDLEGYLDRAADLVRAHIDFSRLPALNAMAFQDRVTMRPPPAQNIALAQDAAFAFSYPHLLEDWRRAGAQITSFSPLANNPVPAADLIYLPGGYPELHAGRLASNTVFLESLRNAAGTTPVYGECGGYMTLGQTLTDADGTVHRMAGLLNLETSFAQRQLHLGYRHLEAKVGPFSGRWTGHEFHYATTCWAEGQPLFAACDATGEALGQIGLTRGRVYGSFAHIIDAA